MENYSLFMGATAVMKMAVEMAAVSMEKPSGGTSPYRSGGTPLQPLGRVPEHLRDDVEGPGPPAALEASRLFVLLNHCSPVGFGRQHILARPVGQSSATTTSTSEMAEEPVKYEDLPPEHKKKYDDLKAILEADLIGAFEKTRSHGIKFKGLVNTLERVALNVVQEIMKHKYSPSGPALGTHQGEIPLYTRPPLPYTTAAPQQQGSPAYVVYKVGGYSRKDCHGRRVAGAGSSSGADAEKQAWLAKYATGTSHERSTSAAPTVDEITAIMRDQFGILPKKRMIGYSKPYPNDYDLIPLPPKYRLPDFTKFSGSEGTSSIEHVSRYLAQLGMVSASDELRVRFFSQSLTGPAFGWYTSLPPDSVRTWKQLEEQFHVQYHSEATEAGIADLTQVRQRRGETVSEYIQRFRTVRNRCYSVRLSEKEAVELAIAGLSAPLKDVTFQADYNSLAHMVQKLTSYEQRHPELYQDKFKRVALIEMEEDEDSVGDQEVAVAEWTRGAKPVSCKWVKQPGPAKGFDFDLSKTEQIFDLLLKEKQLKLPEGHKIPTLQEMNGRPYCKWHHTFTHATNDCKVLRGQIQMAIEQGRLLFGQFAMRVDTQPFPDVNMVDLSHCIRREPGFSFGINMAGLADRHGEDKPESSYSRGKGEEEANPHDWSQKMKNCESSVSIVMKKEADSSDRLKPASTCLVLSMDLAGDGKLGYGFTSADELEEIDIGPGDKPQPTFISKKLDPQLKSQFIALLKEYPDCFAWDYTEMPGLDRSIIEHRLPLNTTRKVAMADEIEVAPWLLVHHGRRFLVPPWFMSKLFFLVFEAT
ncbi:hypothetical protein QYE76_029971 [Lolium multiflorum]|uniref:Retrotransposon gag domain-containing protein n=1 Tax=Lolium multiflorum TaxID=4521 RepID=A0AAD8QSH7_LOLMU|nr:hypothetical protein QYE76_029971 [Lolium multiflorum]